MLEEVITIAAIIGVCAAGVWYAKSKLQPGIERNLERLENTAYQKQEAFQRKHKSQQGFFSNAPFH